MNNLRIIFFGLTIFMVGCASRNDSTKTMNTPTSISPTPELKSMPTVVSENGWGPNPRELSNAKDVNGIQDSNWYTKKYLGKANDRSIELKSPSYMETTCKQAVKKENGRALIESAFASVSGDLKNEALNSLISKISSDELKKIEVSNCSPVSSEKTFTECECLLSYKVEGGKQTLIDKLGSMNK
jgi:hypothetical protein